MYTVAITGASGPIIGIRLINQLLLAGHDVSAIVSNSAWETMWFEIFRNMKKPHSVRDIMGELGIAQGIERLSEYGPDDYFSPAASGTAKTEAVIVAPCSMKTLSAVAHGYSDSLITRGVDVALKEGRKAILVPRETPVSLIHLENMVQVKRAGAHVVLPVPGFYTFPESIDDVVNFIVGKILNLLDIEHQLFESWPPE